MKNKGRIIFTRDFLEDFVVDNLPGHKLTSIWINYDDGSLRLSIEGPEMPLFENVGEEVPLVKFDYRKLDNNKFEFELKT